MKIIAYKIVALDYFNNNFNDEKTGRLCYLNNFVEIINKEIESGWQPYGDMKIPTIEETIPKLIQVMVKYDSGEN